MTQFSQPSPHDEFLDVEWYRNTYPDVDLSGIPPAEHYRRIGRRLGRRPGPLSFVEGVAVSSEVEAFNDFSGYRVDIIIPVFNALLDVKNCIYSILLHRSSCVLHLIIIDDGSEPETRDWLARAATKPLGVGIRMTLIRKDANEGYTRAINAGLAISDGDFVVTQNSDTIVTRNWIERLIRCMRSDPATGIVGPLSNAASWQNVPNLRDESGNFAINTLPEGMTADGMAVIVARASARLYPEVPFLNGFCFMISRAVIRAVGFMDDVNFPIGYGEENDFCIRTLDAGFKLRVCDDAYVFHAKSKSFGHSKRTELSKAGGEALRRKHGAERFGNLVDKIKDSLDLDVVRVRTKTALDEAKGMASADTFLITDVSLCPQPVYARKGYHTEPHFNGPVLKLPLSDKPGRLPPMDIGIHLHLHYTDLADEFAGYLRNVPVPFHLYVSVPKGTDMVGIQSKLSGNAVPNAVLEIRSFENRGRDIGPFLAGFGRDLSRHDYVCHIHSKRSPHNIAKRDWRLQLLSNLMGAPSVVGEILRLFDQNSELGMIFPEYHWSLKNQISWGTNFPLSADLARRMNISVSLGSMAPFPAGSMFWARKAAIAPIFDLGLGFEDFPKENKQVDGTLAHAVERMLGNVVQSTGYALQQICTERPYDLTRYYTSAWPYPMASDKELAKLVEKYHEDRRTTPATVGLLCANAGGYDTTVMHEHLDPRIDYHLVSDFEVPDYGIWIKSEFPQDGSSINRARGVKTNPLPYIKGYKIGVWIDANVMIRAPMDHYFEMVAQNPQIPIFGIPHPQRNCIFDEAQAVIEHKKADPEKVRAQMEAYDAEGYPRKSGLIETNLLIYNLTHPRIAEVLSAWSKEVAERTHRDQLSLNYVLWKLGLDWMPIMSDGHCLRTHPSFAYFGHGRNSGFVSPNIPNRCVSRRPAIVIGEK